MEIATSLSQLGIFEPHGHCFLWRPDLILLHTVSDSITALAYYSIPITLLYFSQKRQDLPYKWIFVLFSVFILACGTTHLMAVWTIWNPDYWLEGAIKAVTAAVSLVTAVLLWPMMPRLLELPSPALLAAANQELRKEIAERKHAQAELSGIRQDLERQVQERTAELSQANAALRADIAERKRAEEELRRSEAYLAEAQRLSHTGTFGWIVSSGEIFWSEETFRIFEYDRATQPSVERVLQRVHPEDKALVQQLIDRASQDGKDLELEYRVLVPSGSSKHLHVVAHRVRDESRKVEFIGAVMDVTAAKMAEQRLKQDEMELRQLVDVVPQHIFVLEPDGSFLYANRRDLEYTGLTLEEVLAPDFLNRIFHPDDLERLRDEREHAIARGVPWESEARLLGKNGQYHWFLIRINPLRDEQGRIIRWYGTRTDIEDRKRAEDALRESEEQWRDVFENNPTMYFVVDPAGIVVSVNPFGAEQLGYTVDEIIGDSVLKVFYEPDRETAKEKVALCLEQPGRSMSWELRKVRKDGTMLWVRETARAALRAKGPIVLVACEDITERKRSEEASLRLVAIVESSSDAIIGKNLDGIVTSWNKGAERIFGYSAEEIIGKPITMVIPPERLDEESRITERLRHGERIESFETVRRRKDGQDIYVFLNISPIKDATGTIIGVSKIARDITESKRSEEALRKAQAELAHVTRVTTLGELTASIAHEVNQPLSGIVLNGNACLRWLGGVSPNLDEAREAAQRIVRDGNRASDVITRIRALARKTSEEKARLNMNDVIQEVAALAQGELQKNGVVLRMELAGDLPQVLGDRVQLQQVILNLVMNGIEAMASVADRPRELLIRSCQHESDKVLVAVQDAGMGIDRENVEQIFNAFYTTKSQGMGMGLAISRSIVENHGGQLWVEPNDGPGATFQFTLLKYQ